jgi:hypothetical protein
MVLHPLHISSRNYGDAVTVTWKRKGDIFPEQEEAVVKERIGTA